MSIKNLAMNAHLERHDICLKAKSYKYLYYRSDCYQNSALSKHFEVLDSRKFDKSINLLILWYRKIDELARRYMK